MSLALLVSLFAADPVRLLNDCVGATRWTIANSEALGISKVVISGELGGRKLLGDGVNAATRTVNGTRHAGDCQFLDAMPDVWAATTRDIKGFADSL